jgi:hypothetical protein
MRTQIRCMLKLLYENGFTFKMAWKKVKEYCEQRGMQMVTLKTANELQQVKEQLDKREPLCNMKKRRF